MDMNDLLNQVETRAIKGMKQHPPFEIGDVVDVGVKIIEGDKTRTQVFNGRVIAKRGGGLRSYFTVRRIVDNEGVERDFPLYAPSIDFIKVKSHGKSRRAKLFYLRERVGKQTRLREVLVSEDAAATAGGAEDAKKKGKKRGAKAKAERATRAVEMEAQKAEARKKKKAAKKAEKAGAGEQK